ncbi:MAG: cell envelope integrity protein TolA [Burkholderiaceae bacterium]
MENRRVESENGFWQAVQIIFILYFLCLAIKMVYVEIPKAVHRYFFVPTGPDNDPTPTQLILGPVLGYLTFLALFAVAALAGAAPIAILALLICWPTVFLWQFVGRDKSEDDDGPTRIWLLVLFCIRVVLYSILALPTIGFVFTAADIYQGNPVSAAGYWFVATFAAIFVILAVHVVLQALWNRAGARVPAWWPIQTDHAKRMRALDAEEVRHKEALAYLTRYLDQLPLALWSASQKATFVQWISREDQRLIAFQHYWDDADRLHWLGEVTGVRTVCHLGRLSPEQQQVRRDLAWARVHIIPQRERQLARNAAEKAKRRAENPVNGPDPAKVARREAARQLKREATRQQKEARDAQYLRDLQAKGRAAREAYRNAR